jgi:extradiol dioxygenase family protein
MPGFIDFQHTTVSVADVDRSLRFYRDLLGFPGVDTCFFADPDGNALELINGTCNYD